MREAVSVPVIARELTVAVETRSPTDHTGIQVPNIFVSMLAVTTVRRRLTFRMFRRLRFVFATEASVAVVILNVTPRSIDRDA